MPPQVAEPSAKRRRKKKKERTVLFELDSSPERRRMILIPADLSAPPLALLSEANLWRVTHEMVPGRRAEDVGDPVSSSSITVEEPV